MTLNFEGEAKTLWPSPECLQIEARSLRPGGWG